MKSKHKIILASLLLAGAVLAIWLRAREYPVPILQPRGIIAEQQRDLIVFASVLSLVVVIPVFVLLFYIVWKYRATNPKAKYSPDWDSNRVLETIWWGIPIALIAVLSVVTWKTTHDLDPFKPLISDKKPIRVQVIALQWKWLFIYPDEGFATVNYVQFPMDTPIDFEITADAPMNSFWIPQLGGQIYAMSGMSTQLHLMADEVGSFQGSSANISGEGFAGMKFVAKSTPQADFEQWVSSVRESTETLSYARYLELARPSKDVPMASFAITEMGLYDRVINKFMVPITVSREKEHRDMQHDEMGSNQQ